MERGQDYQKGTEEVDRNRLRRMESVFPTTSSVLLARTITSASIEYPIGWRTRTVDYRLVEKLFDMVVE